MSNSTLIYASLLNDYGVSNYYSYVHPVLSYFASFQNLMCTIVLASKELRNSGSVFKYLLVNSAGATVACFLFGFLFLTRCGGSICSISSSHWSQVFVIYGVYYVCYVYYMTSGLSQIAISLQLYLVFKKRLKWLSDVSPYRVCLIFYCVFAVLAIVNLFVYEIDSFSLTTIDSNNTKKVQVYYYSHLVKNKPAILLLGTGLVVIGNYVFLAILIAINVLIYSELKRTMAKKQQLIITYRRINPLKKRSKSESIKTSNNEHHIKLSVIAPFIQTQCESSGNREKNTLRRLLIMTLWISTLFSLDRFVKCLYRTVVVIYPLKPFTIYLNAVSYVFDMLIYSSFFFIYMRTNKVFRRKFYQIFLRRNS